MYAIPQSAALKNVRHLAEAALRDSAWEGSSTRPAPVSSVGIVGAGIMGARIAAVHLQRGLPVVVTDCSAEVLESVSGKIMEVLAGEIPENEARRIISHNLQVTSEESAVAHCDLVIEAIIETLAAKQTLFARLDPLISENTILASNTSTIPIAQLAKGRENQSQYCGYHFCHPVQERPLVEIIQGPATSDLTIFRAVSHARTIAKVPVVVKDSPGFLVNRLLMLYLGEALELLIEGHEATAIEGAAREFGMAMGPLQLLDEIGLDTALHAAWVLAPAFPDEVADNPLLVQLVKAGRLGRKTGAGFFDYRTSGSSQGTDGQLDEIAARLVSNWVSNVEAPKTSTIAMRLLLPMVCGAVRLIAQGTVSNPRDIDIAAIFGLGFPAEKGGLLWWADSMGRGRLLEMARSLKHPKMPEEILGSLDETTEIGARFYCD